MSSSYFDVIAQELFKQQQKMQGLVAENHKLRQELADLREGRGIFVEIQHKRFALTIPTIPATPVSLATTSTPTIAQEDTTEPDTSVPQEAPAVPADNIDANAELSNNETPSPTRSTATDPVRKTVTTVRLVEASALQPARQDPTLTPTADMDKAQEEDKPAATPFLEEIMLDEFAIALTSPVATWKKGQEENTERKQQSIEEDQKAALRRELMGSFLLE